jgi:hypothetical protein
MNLRFARSSLLARSAQAACASLLGLALLAGTASAHRVHHGSLRVTGQLVHVAPRTRLNSNNSNNWFGYNIGSLADNNTLFHSITGNWTVPKATQHTKGQAEDSADWIGIGGGCVNANCTVTDSTLIQTGTEQDIATNGSASYDAWYELVPAPELQITNMTVKPGDHMFASIGEAVANSDVWKVEIEDVTRHESYTTTVPYSSTHLTAEWIEETPLEVGVNAGLAALPNLTNPFWTSGTLNGTKVTLTPAERMFLVNTNGKVIGSPSLPNAARSGFGECTWATTCSTS